jgi:hypothetical protein
MQTGNCDKPGMPGKQMASQSLEKKPMHLLP